MKALFLSVCALGLWAGAATAQSMTVAIPGNAQAVPSVGQNMNNGIYWMCGQGQSSASGNHNVLYVDRNGVVNVDGNTNTVYSISTGSITVHGNNNVVYSSQASSITIDGNNNTVHAPADMTVSMSGHNNARMAMGVLSFDYSNAPTGGCRVTASEVTLSAPIEVSPNPVPSGQDVMLPASLNSDGPIYLADALGRVVRTYPAGSHQLSMRYVAAGTYNLRMSLQNELVRVPVVVQQ